MSEEHPSPFPTALVLDTGFLRTIGGTGSDLYKTFSQYVQNEGRELYLSGGVVEELTEQQGYISIDWVDRADTVNRPRGQASGLPASTTCFAFARTGANVGSTVCTGVDETLRVSFANQNASRSGDVDSERPAPI